MREANLLEKREVAATVRATTSRAVAAAQEGAAKKKRLAAAAKRADSAQWAQEKERNKLAQTQRAQVGKQAADMTRVNLKKSTELMTTERKAIVMRDKKCAQPPIRPAHPASHAHIIATPPHTPPSHPMSLTPRPHTLYPSPRGRERMVDYTVAQEKAKQLASNRENVERRYRSKFANANESQLWETVPLRRWYG